MQNSSSSLEDPIAALATPWGRSAIAVIRASGGECIQRLSQVCPGTPSILSVPGHTLHRRQIMNGVSGEPLDEVIVAVYRGPRSYTGEDSAEIFCHGNPVIISGILEALTERGFRPADPGEFTLRAFLNGKMDLTRAEAVNEIVRSHTDRSRSLALARLAGSIERRVTAVKEMLVGVLAAIEVRIDYADEYHYGQGAEESARIDGQDSPLLKTIAEVESELQRLLGTFHTGRIIQQGASVVLAGRTNAGKSTFFNLLLREERSIVSEQHGTTRDYVDAMISVHGIPLRVYDTAGLRASQNPVESEGMRRTEMIMQAADLIVYLVDGVQGFTDEDAVCLQQYGQKGKLLRVWNKNDVAKVPVPTGFWGLSCVSGAGLDEIVTEICRLVLGDAVPEHGEPVLDSLRQKALLERCLVALREFRHGFSAEHPLDAVTVDLREAIACLGEITGEVTSLHVLDRVFRDFCVGK